MPLGAFAALMPEDLPAAESTLDVMRQTADRLRARSGGRPVVLGIDDAQLLDATSAALVLHLVLTGVGFVVVTVRTGEPCPDAVSRCGRTPAWPGWSSGRWATTRGRARRGRARRPGRACARRWMHESSRGNALYVRELLVGALADGALRTAGLLAARAPAAAEHLAGRLIGARLAELRRRSARASSCSHSASRCGSRARDAGGVRRAVGRSARADRGRRATAARLAHPLYGEVVRATVGPARATAPAAARQDVVGTRDPREPGDALRVARLVLDAGGRIPPALVLDVADRHGVAGRAVLVGGERGLGVGEALADGVCAREQQRRLEAGAVRAGDLRELGAERRVAGEVRRTAGVEHQRGRICPPASRTSRATRSASPGVNGSRCCSAPATRIRSCRARRTGSSARTASP